MAREPTSSKLGPIPLEQLEEQDFTELPLDRAYSPGLTHRINTLIQQRKRKALLERRVRDMDKNKK